MKHWLSQNLSWLGIGLVVLALTAWVVTGSQETDPGGPPPRPGTVKVALTASQAELVERVVTLQGHLEPEQTVRVRAKTGGEVVATPVQEGALVARGALIARLDMSDRQARLSEAKAVLQQAETELRAAERLAGQGFQSELALESARAALEAARARAAAIALEIEHTHIKAPIAGVLNTRIRRLGDYVEAGEPVAEIVQNDPLRAVVRIPQHRVTEIAEGQRARVTFLQGEVREGEVSYLSSMADEQTRTFLARVRVDNPNRDLPAGISVTVVIPVQQVRAHSISPALISQNGSGELGVKVAETNDGELRARFVPVEPVKADSRQVWVTGLADDVRLITLGQGFVRDGDPLEVAPQSPPATP